MGLLVDNAHFNGIPKPAEKPAPKAETPPPAREQRPNAGAQGAVSLRETADRPRAGSMGYNPYESMAPAKAYNPYESMPAAATPPRPKATAGPAPRPAPVTTPTTPPQKLYLRVPDREGETYKKALNLCEIFCDGTTAVIFYDMKEGKYYASSLKMRATPFVLTRLEGILGKENVVAK